MNSQPAIFRPIPRQLPVLELDASRVAALSQLGGLTLSDHLIVGLGADLLASWAIELPGVRPIPSWDVPGVPNRERTGHLDLAALGA